jgi:hypothetical protein
VSLNKDTDAADAVKSGVPFSLLTFQSNMANLRLFVVYSGKTCVAITCHEA